MDSLLSRKHVKLLLLLVLSALVLTGCWDRRELEDQAFVQAMGIDKGPSGQLLVSFRIAIPSKTGLGQSGGGGGGATAAKASSLTTVAAPTVPAAITLASGYINREINLMHTKTVIFGEPFARKGLGPLMSLLARYRELRRNIIVCVAKGDARKLLEANDPELEKSYTKYWEGVRLLESKTAIHPNSLFHGFINKLGEKGSAGIMMYLAVNDAAKTQDVSKQKIPPSFKQGVLSAKSGEIPRSGGNSVEYVGAAVFSGDKLIDTLNLAENQAYLLLNGEFQTSFFTFQDPLAKNFFIPIEVRAATPPIIKIDIRGNTVLIKELISLEGDLIAIQSPINYGTDSSKQTILEKAVIREFTRQLTGLVEKFQKKGVDVVGYGEYAQRDFLTRKAWNDFEWPDKFRNAQIDLQVKFKIRRTGLEAQQPAIEH